MEPLISDRNVGS